MITRHAHNLVFLFFLFGVFPTGCLNRDEQIVQDGNVIQGESVPQLQPITAFGQGLAIAFNIAPNDRLMVIKSKTGVYLYDAHTWSKLNLGIPLMGGFWQVVR